MRPVIAPRLVGSRTRRGTLRRQTVAFRGPRAVGFGLAHLLPPNRYEIAGLAAAARPLARTALRVGPTVAALRRTVRLLVLETHDSRITANVVALVIVVTAVALLSGFDDLVSAERARRRGEAVPFFAVVDRVEYVRYVTNAAA